MRAVSIPFPFPSAANLLNGTEEKQFIPQRSDCKPRMVKLGLSPCPVTVTTFLVGDSYKPSFATVTGRGTTHGNTFFKEKLPVVILEDELGFVI